MCRLLNYMDERDHHRCSPLHPQRMSGSLPFLELSSGYVRRGAQLFPRQEPGGPWYRPQNYHRDRKVVMRAPVAAPELEFARAGSEVRTEKAVAA